MYVFDELGESDGGDGGLPQFEAPTLMPDPD